MEIGRITFGPGVVAPVADPVTPSSDAAELEQLKKRMADLEDKFVQLTGNVILLVQHISMMVETFRDPSQPVHRITIN